MIRALLILLAALSFGADARKPPKPPPTPVCSSFGWCNIGVVANAIDNYTPVITMGGDQIRMFSNTDGSALGNLYLRVGNWSTLGSASMVLDVLVARDTYIRTLGVARGNVTGHYYAILYTGDGYPTQGGYSPSWATSSDGYDWATYQIALPAAIKKRVMEKAWLGPIGIFGRNQSSAAALIIDESRTDGYACMAWLDIGSALYLMHAPMPCDPTQWTSDGLNQWPIAGEQAQFVTAARTPYGYHLIGAIGFPAIAHRHVFSCTGLPPWRVLEMDAATRTSAGKGTNLALGEGDGYLHALTSGTHFRIPVKEYPCQ